MIHCPPDLDRVPAEVQPLVSRCLAKDPGLRPAARDVLAATNAARSMTVGSPGPATRTFIRTRALGGPSAATTPLPGYRSAEDAINDAHRDHAAERGADSQRGTDPDLGRVLSGRLSA